MDMKPLSDKDFDKFFQDKFSAFEQKPSQVVWSRISKELSNKKKKSFPVMWIAAASLAAVIGAGVWFSVQKEPMYLHGDTSAAVVNANKKSVQPVENQNMITAEADKVIQKSHIEKHIDNYASSVAVIEEKSISATVPVAKKVAEKQQPEKVMIAAITEPAIEEETKVNLGDQTLAIEENADSETESLSVKQTRIKSVGSLVNFVVGKVDKRKNKIIEFEDNDEGTKVSGLNLGLFKFQAKE